MRKVVLRFPVSMLLLLFFLIDVQKPAQAANQQEIVTAIERIAKQVQEGLSGKVILAGSGKKFYLVRIDSIIDVSYDVQTTTSIVSPYLGILSVLVQVSNNLSSSQSDAAGGTGFSTPARALAAQEPTDFVYIGSGIIPDKPEYHRQKCTIHYSYQGGWVLKSIRGGDFIYLTNTGNEAIFDLFK